MTKSNVIHENDNYIVSVADSHEPVAGGKTYHITNKHTGVIEREDTIWPSAVEAANYFDLRIKEYEEDGDKAEVFPLSIN